MLTQEKGPSASLSYFNLTKCADVEGVVSVHNVATQQNGDFDVIDGTATAPDPEHPGELEVSFPGSKCNKQFLIF